MKIFLTLQVDMRFTFPILFILRLLFQSIKSTIT